MPNRSHTPIPWTCDIDHLRTSFSITHKGQLPPELDQTPEYGLGFVGSAFSGLERSGGNEETNEANAEFIVRACNAHEQLVEALKPFAENPKNITDDYPCHSGICPKEKCGRCGRAIAAWNAIKKAEGK